MKDETMMRKFLSKKAEILAGIHSKGFARAFVAVSNYVDFNAKALVINMIEEQEESNLSHKPSMLDINEVAIDLEEILGFPEDSVCVRGFSSYEKMRENKYFKQYIEINDMLGFEELKKLYQDNYSSRKLAGSSVVVQRALPREKLIGKKRKNERLQKLKILLEEQRFTLEEVTDFVGQCESGNIEFHRSPTTAKVR